jgi:FemAB-related protein (PEP-CTERM system-associated)
MKIEMRPLDPEWMSRWNRFVRRHPDGTLFHLADWGPAIQQTYGHAAFLLRRVERTGRIRGVLPLVHLKGALFGNRLVSVPFFDNGGVLADSPEDARELLRAALSLGRRLSADLLEFRQRGKLQGIHPDSLDGRPSIAERDHKVGMVLELPDSSDALMKGFKSKLRSQIRRPAKEGLVSRVGSRELLPDFYHVFGRNMRDLGSPVHSRELFEKVIQFFPQKTRIVMVYGPDGTPMAGSLVIGHRDTLSNPWASALREYSRLSPNMLLYWSMLAHACERGYRFFDFGRSTPHEGTYRFKKQWGASPRPLTWYTIRPDGGEIAEHGMSPGRFQWAIECWKKLPLPLARRLGPLIRRQIDL